METTNRMQLRARWADVRGRILEAWGDLTDDDLSKTQGEWDRLVAVIRERTGDALETVERRLDDLIESLDETVRPRS
jgi:uncharacterized protein YjbJ (UPF0337 family)